MDEDDIVRTDWYTVSFDILRGFLFTPRVILVLVCVCVCVCVCVLRVEWKDIFKNIEFIMGLSLKYSVYTLFIKQRQI